MCVAFWFLEHLDYALVLCTNRDEYLSRPTLNAHFHSFEARPEDYRNDGLVLSGRDLQAGGSWFGINRAGKVALLTNITEELVPRKASRGHLVSSFLLSDVPDSDQFTQRLVSSGPKDYAGFNLVLFSPTPESDPGKALSYTASFVTNSGGGGAISCRALQDEELCIGGVSNGIDSLGGKEWPKVKKGEACLSQLFLEDHADLSEEDLVNRLFDLLTWQSAEPPNNRSQLRNSIQIPPLRISSSLAKDARPDGPEYYGTRLSTVLLVRKDGQVLFIERDIWQLDSNGQVVRGDPREDRRFRFVLGERRELPEVGAPKPG